MHAGTNHPRASKERDNRGASEFPRVPLECIPGTKNFRRVASSYRYKESERPYSCTSFLYVHYKLCSKLRLKRRLHVQNRPAGCVLSRTYPSQQQKVPQVRLREQGVPVLSATLRSEHSPSGFLLGHTVTGYLHRQGIWVIPYLDYWLIHHPDRQVLLRHQAQLINTLDLVGVILNRKKSELDLTQDLQFLGIPLRLYLGEASLPESKAWEIVARARRVLTYSQVSQLMGSLNCASGLIPLGRLFLRPLQRHFHSLGLTNRFTPLRRSDPLVLANLLRHWQDLRFLTSGIPIHTFQRDASTQGWGTHMGDSQISGTWTHTDHKLHINCQELKAVVSALQHWAPVLQGHQVMIATDNSTVVSYINKQGGTHSPTLLRLTVELLLWLDSQNIIVRARHIPGCLNVIADHLSHPNQPISTEWSLHPEIMKHIFRSWGTNVCNSVKLPPSLVHVSNSGATSPSGGCSVSGLAGEVNVHVSSIPSAQQSHSEAPVHPGGRGSSHSPLVAESVVVSTPTSSLCGTPPGLSLPSGSSVPAGSDGKWYHLHAWRLSCDTIKQQAFQTRSLGSRQPLGGPQPMACTKIGGFALLDGPQGKGLIRLIPQLLR